MVLSLVNFFSGGLRLFISTRVAFRLFTVIKCMSLTLVQLESAYICDFQFILVRQYRNPGHILHRIGDIAGFCALQWPHPYSTLILGRSRWTISPMWSIRAGRPTLSYSAVKLFAKNSNLCDHGTCTLQTDRRTDRRHTDCGITAVYVASRCKKCTVLNMRTRWCIFRVR